MRKKRIVILGGGFGGVFAGKKLEKLIRHERDKYEIILISKSNYFTYQPMLAEIVGGSVGILDSINSLRSLLPNTSIYVREITEINIANQTITLSPNFSHTDFVVAYDYLLIALGNVADFQSSPSGIAEHSIPFKTLKDTITLRNHLIDVLETAASETSKEVRKKLLTFVVVGGGFSGVEIAAEMNDLIRRKVKKNYKSIHPNEVKIILVHNKKRLVHKELGKSLGEYCGKILKKKGVKLLLERKLQSATPHEAILNDQTKIYTSTIITTSPQKVNPLIETLPLELKEGRVLVDHTLRAVGHGNIFAVGDCAYVPMQSNMGFAPQTAQFAVQEGKCAAKNIIAHTQKKPLKTFHRRNWGMLAGLGHHHAVAELAGGFRFSGFFAWLLWRFTYLFKLPGFRRKVKVMLSWILEGLAPQDLVQLNTIVHEGIRHLHYEKGETVFEQGDIGDYLYVISQGQVEVIVHHDGYDEHIATLGKGEYFGEMAILNQKKRNATIRCLSACDFIAILKEDFEILTTNFSGLKEEFLKTQENRKSSSSEEWKREDREAM